MDSLFKNEKSIKSKEILYYYLRNQKKFTNKKFKINILILKFYQCDLETITKESFKKKYYQILKEIKIEYEKSLKLTNEIEMNFKKLNNL